ncbi:unnamed protein product [Rhizophagus irregularis]|nr:unnamed protein product [Rhizophagus irregularis]
MEISKEESEGRSKNLWKYVDYYHEHVTIINPITKSEEIKMSYMEGLEEGNPYVEDTHSITEHEKNKVTYKKGLQEGLFVEYSHPIIKFEENKVIYMEDLEKRKEAYGICGECGFGEIYSADFPEGFINCWDIDNQKWDNITNKKWVLKSLGNNNLTPEFLNEVGSHLQIFIQNVIVCRGITQDPSTNNYMMVLDYCDRGDLRNLNISELDYKERINILVEIARGLLEIHNAGKVHKDFHSGNILFYSTHYDERDIQSREAKWQINILSDSLQDNEENNDNNSTCYSNFKDALENFKINKVEDDKDDENGKDDKDDDYGDDEDDNKDREDIYLENIEDTYETIDYDESDCVAFFSEIYNQIKECEKIRENKLKDKNELKNIKATTYSQETYSSSLTPENENSQYRLISDHYSDCEID